MAKIVLIGEFREIKLTQNFAAIIDAEDYERVSRHKWYADVGPWNIYAKTDQLPSRPRMHVFINRPDTNLVVHHVNGDGLHNYKENLENLTHKEHTRLSALRRKKKGSVYRGVYWHSQRSKYAAEIWVDYKKHYLGLFISEIDAAIAYDEAAMELLGPGKFIPNFPSEITNG